MAQLRTALHELADQHRPIGGEDAAELWVRGRARVRRRRVVTVGVVVGLAVLASLAVARPEPTVVMPAGTPHRAAIPMNVYQPNRFLAGLSDQGPPGRLALIARGKHGWFGISGTTGAYVRLDLPAMAKDSFVALSPDGNRLAYWVTGPTRKEDFGPETPQGEGGPFPTPPIGGVGVYDVREGSVQRHLVDTDFGLVAGGGDAGLAWLTDTTLTFGFLVATGPNTANDGQSYAWQPGQRPVKLDAGTWAEARYTPSEPGPHAIRQMFTEGEPYVEVDENGRPTGKKFRLPEGNLPDVSLRAGRVVATGGLGSTSYDNVFTGLLPPGSTRTTLTRVGMVAGAHFLGWLSDSTVLVHAAAGERDGAVIRASMTVDGEFRRGLFAVDLTNGRTVQLGQVDSDVSDAGMQVARSLLDAPMVHGRKPPSVLTALRVPLAVGGSVLLVVAAGFVLHRRRRG